MLANRIFPNVKKWVEIDLEKESRNTGFLLNNPKICQKWVEILHLVNDCDGSFGGYLENRENLWEGTYLPHGKRLHLGVDINVPVYSPVLSPINGEVVEIIHDLDFDGGWGECLIIQSNVKVIFAHMQEVDAYIGKKIKTGDVLGLVGRPERNGGWYPHLHLQVIPRHISLSEIDGYGDLRELDSLKKIFPNPIDVI